MPSLMSACAAANARKGYFRAFSPWRDGALGAHTPRAFAARPISRRNWRGLAAPILMPRLPEARERRTTISLWRSTRGKEPSACKKGGPKPPFKIVGLCVCLPRPPGAGLQRDDRPMPESAQSLRPGVEHADAVGPKARRVPRVRELDEFGELAPVTGVAGF